MTGGYRVDDRRRRKSARPEAQFLIDEAKRGRKEPMAGFIAEPHGLRTPYGRMPVPIVGHWGGARKRSPRWKRASRAPAVELGSTWSRGSGLTLLPHGRERHGNPGGSLSGGLDEDFQFHILDLPLGLPSGPSREEE